MKVSQRGLGTAKRAARSAVLAGIALVAAIATESHAQNVPYQSSLRDQFGTGPSRDPLPRGGFFLPRVEGAIQYAENLTLADDASPQVNSAGVELAPGFFTSYSGDSFLGAADYSLIGRAWEESDFDDISHRLAAGGRWTAAQDLFYVDGTAGYFDSIIDPAAGSNFGGIGLLGRDNLAETATATISPTLRKRIREMEFQASYSYGRVWYLDLPDAATTPGVVATEEDSTDQTVRVSFGTAEPERLLTGRVFYDWDKSEFEVSLPYRYDRAGVEGGWRTSDFVTLVADAGLESALDENTTDGGLDDSFWHAGVRWEPDEQTVAEARYGQRFFGDSYYLNIEREARFLRIQASYSEEPTVESRRISTGDFIPGSLPFVQPGLELGRITADPFVAKVARIEATANGSRTEVSVVAYDSQRDYLSGPLADETTVGGNLLVTRQFAANLSGDFFASYEEYETGAEGTEAIVGADRTYLTEIFLRLNRAVGSKITTSLEGGYKNQGGEFTYDGWWVALRARYEPVR